MLKIIYKWLLALILLTSSQLILAAGLTEKQVQNYLDSVPEMQALGEKYKTEQKKIDRARPLSSSLELMGKNSDSYRDLTTLAKKHAFEDAEQWADVGDRVMQAFIVSQSEVSLEQMKMNYEQAIANISNNPEYSSEKKQAVLKGMEKGYLRNVAMVKKAQPDLAVVKAKKTAIQAIFD